MATCGHRMATRHGLRSRHAGRRHVRVLTPSSHTLRWEAPPTLTRETGRGVGDHMKVRAAFQKRLPRSDDRPTRSRHGGAEQREQSVVPAHRRLPSPRSTSSPPATHRRPRPGIRRSTPLLAAASTARKRPPRSGPAGTEHEQAGRRRPKASASDEHRRSTRSSTRDRYKSAPHSHIRRSGII